MAYTGMRAELNQGQIANKFKKPKALVDEAKALIMYEAAAYVVLRSPVDTGTYMDNWNIGAGNDVPLSKSQSSDRKPRNQPWQPYSDKAINRMDAQISNLPEGWKRASIGNTAYHADEVEYTHGYAVFTALRAAWPALKQKAIAQAEAKFR